MAPADVAATLAAVRAACPGLLVGVSTGSWITGGDVGARRRAVAGWTVLPDFASVNMSEDGAAELCRHLLERGVGIEAGLAGPDDVARLADSGVAAACLRHMIEIDADPSAPAQAAAVWDALDRLDLPGVPRLLHGLDASFWPLFDAALARGCDTRVGLEDVLRLPDGSLAPDNAALVAAAVARMGRAQARAG